MYGKKKPAQTQSSSDKNPNRVAGGLRAQGADTMMMVSEDGSQQELPTLAYVRSLEEQGRKMRTAINNLERKLSRQESTIATLESYLRK
jgi:TolA-binding protein